ncbi:hypothetical protein CSA80_01170 [Candidatus Saccharibacteria bacterium]|nr:MAG: hypothetical protein CR973_01985 [Candidatus Saccharibacteria bacterium]PID99358.1 MAG: hypothetical protein CSA80_01170 [Candidatus Saccharibacteria bacterium]
MRLVTVRPAVIRPSKKRRLGRRITLAVVVLLAGLCVFQFVRPLPDASVRLQLAELPQAKAATLNWPNNARAALAANGYGMLGTHGSTAPLATASIAKVIIALCVLEKYPLNPGEQGPTITMTWRDRALYEEQIQQNGSRIAVRQGMQLSEYQALQALLIPSANNIADSLAIWAFGDHPNYARYANDFLQRHGLISTKVGSDASGLSPTTVSTATDLARLGLIARKNAVLMEIAGQKSVTLPFAGKHTNYNRALGKAGINGLKTGNNEANPGALLFTTDAIVSGHSIELSGVVMGAATLQDALDASVALAASVTDDFEHLTLMTSRQRVGTLTTAWGVEVPIRLKDSLSLIRWKEQAVTARHTIQPAIGTSAQSLGVLSVRAGEQTASSILEITEPASGPSWQWRLTRFR